MRKLIFLFPSSDKFIILVHVFGSKSFSYTRKKLFLVYLESFVVDYCFIEYGRIFIICQDCFKCPILGLI